MEGETGSRFLRLSGLKFGGRIATGANYVETGFNTDVDRKDGQKILMRNSSLDTSGTPYFVVVTGKVVAEERKQEGLPEREAFLGVAVVGCD